MQCDLQFVQRERVRENAVGPTDPALVPILGNLAQMLRSLSREDEAAKLEARAQDIEEANPEEIALMRGGTGIFTSSGLVNEPDGWGEHMAAAGAAEDDQETEKHLLDALALAEAQGSAGPHLGETLHALGTFNCFRGELGDAEAQLQRAISVREAAFGPTHARVVDSINNLAEVYRALERYEEALPLLERALFLSEAADETDEIEIATSLNNLASIYEHLDRPIDAEDTYQRALTLVETALGDSHPSAATILRGLAWLKYGQRRAIDSEEHAERAVSISKRNSATEPDLAAHDLHLLALTQLAQEKYADAASNFASALKLFESVSSADSPELIHPLLNYASALWKAGQNGEEKAEKLVNRALSIAEENFGSDHPMVALCLEDLAKLYIQQGRDEEAQRLHARLQAIGSVH